MAERPEFDKPETTEQLVQLYDYIYQESASTLQHKSGRTLGPYGSHANRDGSHLHMLDQICAIEGWEKPFNKYTLLDASCGRGHLLTSLLNRGFEAQGTEVGDYLLENDLKDLPVTKANYDDITSLGKGSFDVVFSNDVLEHLVDKEMVNRAMKNLCAVSKKWLCISVGLLGTAATKYPSALGLKVKRLHEFCKDRTWWADYLERYLKKVHTPAGTRNGMGFFYGEKR